MTLAVGGKKVCFCCFGCSHFGLVFGFIEDGQDLNMMELASSE